MNIKKRLEMFGEELLNKKVDEHDFSKLKVRDIVVSALFENGHIHTALPDNEKTKNLILDDVLTHYPRVVQPQPKELESKKKEPPKQVIFHNRQALGDILTMTCAIRDFKKDYPETRIGVATTAMHIWDNNPNIDHSFHDTRHVLKIGPGFLTNKSNTWNHHMCNAFRLDVENKLSVPITQGPIRPDIWMTKEEYERPPLIDGPYWVFVYGGEPGWPAKQYHRWQEVINLLRDDIQFVQLGVKSHPYPALNGCINYIGKTEDRNTGIRDLFNIFLHAQGSLGLVSMHTHLSAAFNNPCVTVAGAREPAWFTNYFGHQYVQTNGTMFCSESKACWACKLEGCRNRVKYGEKEIPKCVSIIEPEEIAEAVRKYYKGGRLEYGKKIPNTFFKNIVGEKKVFVMPTVNPQDTKVAQDTELTWGGGSITDRDWLFMKDIIQDEEVKTVLEFGAGLSTVMMGEVVEKIITYETMPGWINRIVKLIKHPEKHSFRKWDGVNFTLIEGDLERFDFAFVDGPAGGRSREFSTKAAAELADIVIIHDAGREPERMWQEKYLKEKFDLVAKGGHRCHFWKRKDLIKREKEKACCEMVTDKPISKVITTTRGFGGSERSTIEIMAMLQEKGYHVQLSPTGDMSWEYKKNIPEGVQLVDWERIGDPVDVAVLYTSDTIWNYGKPLYTSTMPHLKAKRKVMVVNFKLGGVGLVDWTKGWDKYLFLNHQHAGELLIRIPDAKTKVMAPPTDLSVYFENGIDYSFPLKLIRHNSQGDAKHHPDNNKMIEEILALDSTIQFHFMPARSDCMDHPNVFKYPKNKPPVPEFLRNGNCFLYRLPDKYTEGGPKVIMEAMASGLPVICDNHSGPADRVTSDTGWLCNNWNDYIEAIKEILNDPSIIIKKGKEARLRAHSNFNKQIWIDEIIN
jgi:ADP-heptose:LPS heptosyltransferase